jgi:pyrimidine deaminase RibD-like protein
MLIREKLPPGHIYPQITDVPVSYAEFLNFFRGGHTVDDNFGATAIAKAFQATMVQVAILGGHLTKTKNMAMPSEFLVDITLTKSGAELIQATLDRQFCEMAVAEAKRSIAEDTRLRPKVGAVVVKGGKVLATGYRCESGKGDHGEFCAFKKLNADVDKVDLSGCTVYTTLEPCSKRNAPKRPCTQRLIEGKVARVVFGMPDKDESVYGHHTLIEAGIEIGVFPHDLIQELFVLNKEWTDSLRAKPIVPPNNTSQLANVSYYKLGTSMADNTHFFVRPPMDAGGFFTVEDANKEVLAHGKTIEEIAIQWKRLDAEKTVREKLVRQSHGSSNQLLNLP